MRKSLVIFSVLVLMFSMTFVSAGFWDWFTGDAVVKDASVKLPTSVSDSGERCEYPGGPSCDSVEVISIGERQTKFLSFEKEIYGVDKAYFSQNKKGKTTARFQLHKENERGGSKWVKVVAGKTTYLKKEGLKVSLSEVDVGARKGTLFFEEVNSFSEISLESCNAQTRQKLDAAFKMLSSNKIR